MLNTLTTAMHSPLDAMGRRMQDGLNEIFRAARQRAEAPGDGPLFQIVPSGGPLTSYRDALQDVLAFEGLDRLTHTIGCALCLGLYSFRD